MNKTQKYQQTFLQRWIRYFFGASISMMMGLILGCGDAQKTSPSTTSDVLPDTEQSTPIREGKVQGATGDIILRNMHGGQTIDIPEGATSFQYTPGGTQHDHFQLQIEQHPEGQCCYFEHPAQGQVALSPTHSLNLVCAVPQWHHPKSQDQTFLAHLGQGLRIKGMQENAFGDILLGFTSFINTSFGQQELQLAALYHQNLRTWERPDRLSFEDPWNFQLPVPNVSVTGSILNMALSPKKDLFLLRQQNIDDSNQLFPFFEQKTQNGWDKSQSTQDLLSNLRAQAVNVHTTDEGLRVAVWKTSDHNIHVLTIPISGPSTETIIGLLDPQATRARKIVFEMNALGDGMIFWTEHFNNRYHVMHVQIEKGKIGSLPTSYDHPEIFALEKSSEYAGDLQIQGLFLDKETDDFVLFFNQDLYDSNCFGGAYPKYLIHRSKGAWHLPKNAQDTINLDLYSCGYQRNQEVLFSLDGSVTAFWEEQSDYRGSIQFELITKIYSPKTGWHPAEKRTYTQPPPHPNTAEKGVHLKYTMAVYENNWGLMYTNATKTAQNKDIHILGYMHSQDVPNAVPNSVFEAPGQSGPIYGPEFLFINPDQTMEALISLPQQGLSDKLVLLKTNQLGQWQDLQSAVPLGFNPQASVNFIHATTPNTCGAKSFFWSEDGKVYLSQYR